MASTQDTEITLGTAKLLSLFFGLVIVCAVFFALGYTLGRKTDSGFPSVAGAAGPAGSNAVKPAGSAGGASSAPMTFYKAVEQKSADSQLTPAAGDAASGSSANSSAGTASGEQESQSAKLPDPMAPIPGTGYFVQVAAVTKQDDADALVDALKKKQYPAFVAGSAADKYFRVQLGPFGDLKEAETVRTRLINDGYNPILKK
jgi:DedD protein